MSLPNYLAKIKSSGIYRFVFDKSAVDAQTAETLRLVVGYSEKGPFNTPVYLENEADFITIFGNISKRLERKGVYFHRMAIQALAGGPILALNMKPFENEKVNYISFDAVKMATATTGTYDDQMIPQTLKVADIYNTNRFWALDADQLPSKINGSNYISIAATDTKENSCTIFVRPFKPESYSGITIRQWYNSQSLDMPNYLDVIQDTYIDNYFAEVYVFRGEFTKELCSEVEGVKGPLEKYFIVNEKDNLAVNTEYENAFGEVTDVLEVMADDVNSNFVGVYSGCLLPYFKDGNGNYVSLDIKFNAENAKHKMMMKLDEAYLDKAETADEIINALCGFRQKSKNDATIDDVEDNTEDDIEVYGAKYPAMPIYLGGYVYETIKIKGKEADSAESIQSKSLGMLKTKGLRTALTNRVDVEYHYIIDTYDTLLGSTNKSMLSLVAKEKDNAFAILNFPKASIFMNDDKYKSNKMLDFKEIVSSGGFAIPGESDGASYAAFYTQLTFSDGTLKTVVPSAAIVSNNFMEKWNSRQPYYIVAGPTYGALSYAGMTGPDYNYGRSDLDVLEPYGVNAIIYVPRKGTYINSNQTAKQVPVTALSKIHIRELVIFLQNEIEALLQTYQWELNTQALRDTIKAKADSILDTIMNNGGVYAYKNICDSSNNTPEIIDNEMIILDTEIEPARGAGKMVHQLTIHKTGGLTSSVK